VVHDNTPDSDNGEESVPGRISYFIENTVNNFIIVVTSKKPKKYITKYRKKVKSYEEWSRKKEVSRGL
jgi:hypothetical protein